MKNILKKILTFTLVLALLIVFIGCSKTESKKVSELEKIKSKKEFIIGTSPDYPPFEFIISDNGNTKIVGADIELAKKIASDLGVKLKIKSIGFDGLIPALKSGKVDAIITGMTPNEKRKKQVDFSDIYFDGKNGIIVTKENENKIKNEEQLKSLKIGVQKGSTQETYVKDTLKAKNVKSLIAVTDLVQDLKNKNIDVIILNDKVAKINSEKYDGLVALKGIKLSSEEEKMAIAVKKGNNKELLKEINKTIKKIKDNKEYDKILSDSVDLISKEKK